MNSSVTTGPTFSVDAGAAGPPVVHRRSEVEVVG